MEEEKKKVNLFEIFDTQVKPILVFVKKYWYVAAILGAIGFVTGFFLERSKPTYYSANISYLLEDEIINDQSKTTVSGGQLLNALMGASPASGNKGILVDLGMSNRLVELTLLHSMNINGQKQVLANYYIEKFNYSGSFKEKNPYPENYKTGTDNLKDYMLRVFSKNIKLSLISKSKESGILTMDFNSTDELFTKLFLEQHLKTISDFYIDKKIERARALVGLAKRKRDSLLLALQGKSYGAASISDNLFGAVMKRARVPETQLGRDVAITTAQYTESVNALASASLDLERRKPFINIVDDVRMPLDSVGPHPVAKAIAFGVGGIVLGLLLLIGLLKGKEFLHTQRAEFKTVD